jgi:hypothetical protein
VKRRLVLLAVAAVLLAGCGYQVELTEPPEGGVAVEATGRFLQMWGWRIVTVPLGLIGLAGLVLAVWLLWNRDRGARQWDIRSWSDGLGDRFGMVCFAAGFFWLTIGWPLYGAFIHMTGSETVIDASSETVRLVRCYPFHCVEESVTFGQIDGLRFSVTAGDDPTGKVHLDLIDAGSDSWLVVSGEPGDAQAVYDLLLDRLDDYIDL